MGLLDNSIASVSGAIGSAMDYAKENPISTALGVGAVVGTGALVTTAIVKAKRKKKSKRKNSRKKTYSRRSRRSKSRGRRTPRTAGKGKDRSTKRIRYTKNGQPYVITRSGKAKFIKRSSAKRSHKLKGGRY